MKKSKVVVSVIALMTLMAVDSAFAASSDITLLTSQDNGEGQASYSVSLQVLFFMTMLSMLPAAKAESTAIKATTKAPSFGMKLRVCS